MRTTKLGVALVAKGKLKEAIARFQRGGAAEPEPVGGAQQLWASL